VKIFEADGWRIARQRGSHIILVKDGHIDTLSAPDHRELAKRNRTLRSLIRASGLTPDEFISLIGSEIRYDGTRKARTEATTSGLNH